MNQALRENKRIIRAFMRDQYTDARLAQLLDHARDGQLAYNSCCCFIGITTADHELAGAGNYTGWEHYGKASCLPYAYLAERAFNILGRGNSNERRRALIIPLIKAEIRRRMRAEESPESRESRLINDAMETAKWQGVR
jgi:hypothetical protein